MGKVYLDEQILTDIADATRSKTGSSASMTPGQMADAIEGIYDFTKLGYSQTPSSIPNGYQYALEVKNNWENVADLTDKMKDKLNLIYMPVVDTSNATNMQATFARDLNLEYVPLLNTSNVTQMNWTFERCVCLHSGEFNNWDTSNVTNMRYMFTHCDSLRDIKLNYNTEKVTTMEEMFSNSRHIKNLDLSSFNTPQLTNTRAMFYYCFSLEVLDMRNFDFTNITNYTSMFGGSSTGVKNDCLIIVKDQTQKDWILGKFSRFTNVKTVAEYEASLGEVTNE